MDELDYSMMKQAILVKQCRFRRWNRQQRKRGSFYHEFLVSESARNVIERGGGSVKGNLITFPKGTRVFLGPVYLLPDGHSVRRHHRFDLVASGYMF